MSPLPAPDANARPRILVMRYRFIGDTLLTVPFLRNLRRAYPHARIEMLVGPNSGEVLTHCPYVDELIYFDTTRKHRYENTGVTRKSFWHYVGLLRGRQYDMAFVLKRSLSAAALAFLAGIPHRIGFDTEHRGWLLTHRVPYRGQEHEVAAFLNVLRAVDIPVTDAHLESWWSPQDAQAVEIALEPFAGRRNVVLHLTSSNTAKQWPQAEALRFTEKLLQEHSDITLHCLGAVSDSPVYESLRSGLSPDHRARVKNWCGRFSLLESMAFLSRMTRVIGVDSGTLHMAAAAGVPVTVLFGPMDERKWAPPGATVVTGNVPCRPCNLKITCHHAYECMSTLTAEQVLEACGTHNAERP